MISLSKGSRIDLEKTAPGLNLLRLGLGWDARVTDGAQFDADVSLLMLNAEGKAIGEEGFLFYGTAKNAEGKQALPCGSAVHSGDNRTGEGDGDDEFIDVYLDKIPASVEKLLVAVTIDKAVERGQNFGQIDSAYISLSNQEDGSVIAKYDLTEDYSTETCLVFAEVYKKDGTWRAMAKGDGFAGGLAKFLETYGLSVG
jgi:tellurium resistance protein TerD